MKARQNGSKENHASRKVSVTKRARAKMPHATVMRLVREIYGGEPYEYYALGKHIVAARGVCGGRPTFKYTRIRVDFILDLLASGRTIQDLVGSYSASSLTEEAIMEALQLAPLSGNRND